MTQALLNPIRSKRFALLGRWERGELTGDQLLQAMLAISAGQWRFRKYVIARELDRKLQERER